MTEKHRAGKDGILNDGVSYYPADSHDLQSYRDAAQALSQLPVPLLQHFGNRNERIFIAAFDGTGNNAYENPEHRTNVATILEQLSARRTPGIEARYVTGPGTQHNPIERLIDGARGHTYDERIEEMYAFFIEQARLWLAEDPHALISIAEIGFSRGAEMAAGFARLVQKRGIQDPAGAHYELDAQHQIMGVTYTKPPLVAPGQVAQVLGLFDPVGTGEPVEEKDRRPPPSVISGFQIIAEDERRGAFKSTYIIDPGLSPDGRFLGVVVGGAHSDIGGSYHRDGLSVRSGNLMMGFLNALSDQPFLKPQREPDDPRMNVAHRSEEGMLIYRVLPQIDRLETDGHVTQLVPDRLRRHVLDPNNAEPVDEALNARFERRRVPMDVVPDAREPAFHTTREERRERAEPHRTRVDDLFDQLCLAARNPDEQISREQMRGVVQEYRCTPEGQQFQQDVAINVRLRETQERQVEMEAQLQWMQEQPQQPHARGMSR